MAMKKRTVRMTEWTITCERCGYRWKSLGDAPPKRCSKCKTPYYAEPRRPRK